MSKEKLVMDKGARRFAPIIGLAAAALVVLGLDLDSHISLTQLAAHEAELKHFAASAPVLAAGIFVTLYIVIVALSLPLATIMTLSGGLIFGVGLGWALTLVGASAGACVIFLATKTAIGDSLKARTDGHLKQFEQGFARHAASYLLFVRFVPLFPFFVVNIASALVGAGFWVFALTTIIGIAPGAFVYAALGNGMGLVLAQGGLPDMGIIFNPAIWLPLAGLGVLSLAPIGGRYVWHCVMDK